MKNLIFNLSESIKKGELAIFCGAGISLNSGLPLANDMIKSILDTLPMDVADRDEVTKSNIPFEAFIETLLQFTDISRLLDIFSLGIPNSNHILIARIAKEGYLNTILTTNFDQLIEKAFEKEGLIRSKDFMVYYNEEQFSGIDFKKIDNGIINIFKIHGTVEDKESIRTTLKAVANRKLSEKRMKIIRYLFSNGEHKKILILGYSCSDEFDITPQIQSLGKTQKEIFFVEHSKSLKIIENIKNKNNKNPFKQFSGIRAICETNNFMENLWGSIWKEKYEHIFFKKENDCVEFIKQWPIELHYLKYFICGSLCMAIQNFKQAIKYYKETLEFTMNIKSKPAIAESYFSLGNSFQAVGDIRQAINYYEEALKIYKSIGDTYGELKCYTNLGIQCFRSNNIQQAMGYYEKALEISIVLEDKAIEAKCYDEVGILFHSLGYFEEAIELCKQALRIAEDIGDKVVEAACYGNLGIVYLSLKNFKEAKYCQTKDLEIAKAIGDRVLEARCYANLANVYSGENDSNNSIKFNQQATDIFKSVSDKTGEAKTQFSMGVTFFKINDFPRGIEILLNAEKLFIETNQIQDLKKIYDILFMAYKIVGDINEAIKVQENKKKLEQIILNKKDDGAGAKYVGPRD